MGACGVVLVGGYDEMPMRAYNGASVGTNHRMPVSEDDGMPPGNLKSDGVPSSESVLMSGYAGVPVGAYGSVPVGENDSVPVSEYDGTPVGAYDSVRASDDAELVEDVTTLGGESVLSVDGHSVSDVTALAWRAPRLVMGTWRGCDGQMTMAVTRAEWLQIGTWIQRC